MGGLDPRDVVDVLDRDGNAVVRTQRLAVLDRAFGLGSRLAGRLLGDGDERVRPVVSLVDTLEVIVDNPDGGQLAVSDLPYDPGCGTLRVLSTIVTVTRTNG